MAARWGNFLQQAVAGVESRLDNILGETEEIPKVESSSVSITAAAPVKSDTALPRKPATSNPSNDRLQERLARAIAAKNHASSASNTPSRVASPATVVDSPRHSMDASSVRSDDLPTAAKEDSQIQTVNSQEQGRPSVEVAEHPVIGLSAIIGLESSPRLSIESAASSVLQPSLDSTQPVDDSPAVFASTSITSAEVIGGPGVSLSSTLQEQSRQQTSNELERSDLERQEEIHGYIERIDALQAKLQYLSRESAESARKAAAAAPAGTAEKKLAEKDEQIALLMEEGQKLSKTELKHLTIIKKLRLRSSEVERESAEAQKKIDKAEKDKAIFAERLRRIDAIEKQANERQKALAQTQKELEVVTTERDQKNVAITQLKAQLQESISQAKANEVKIVQEQLEVEKRRAADLENELSSAKIEKELAMARAKVQLDELRAKSEREAERARVMEVDLKAEQQMLESKLEALRTRAEEVSSGATGDAQAKLLRQIETHQSQYAIASENWQRIEASLTSRVTTLEKERDEALKRETDIRRKAREVTLKAKRNEDELEDTRNNTSAFQRELVEQKEQLSKLQLRAGEAESALLDARKSFDEEKQRWAAELSQRVDDERVKWREELMGHGLHSYSHSRAESPVASTHRSLTAEYLGLQNIQTRRASARSITQEGPTMEKILSRKSSAQPIRSSGRATPGTPIRQDSIPSFMTNGEATDTPSIQTMDHDDYFDNITSPSFPHDKINDVISVSTVGAGPSVQLVERMSAAVRRLESEKVSTKEELARLAGQRDEARAEILSLMQEVEAKRTLDSRVEDLENENNKINARYQTTLEMLGEKSELVEELRADVQDVKAMYRELVERTIK